MTLTQDVLFMLVSRSTIATSYLVGWILFIRFGAIMGLTVLRFVYDPRVSKGRQHP